MRKTDLSISAAILLAATVVLAGAADRRPVSDRFRTGPQPTGDVTEGSLIRVDPYGTHTGERCPLRHTDVKAEISGFVARVTVTQEFENKTPDKIEAIYTFPLPPMSAVDDMTMLVGDRTIKAQIKRREEARQIYDQARAQGHTAALLEQQRPNIFTQSVTNIEPNAKVKVTISYVETLKYDEGTYEFSFPMTVGPRYTPASMDPNDARAVVPKYAPPETRAGHDVSLAVTLDAGVPIDALISKTHEIDVQRPSTHQATLKLKQTAVIPNKDFILRYDVAGARIQDTLITHYDSRGGFFTLILQPPERVTVEDVTPKELVFVLDTSGSMSGFPIEKAKEAMRMAIAGLYPRDTFNLITFSGETHILFPQPVPATPENSRQAQQFLSGTYGSGGTEMMKAVRAAFAPSGDSNKVRVICFMTDGYVGNENEIIAEVQRHPEARVFSFGIGSAVNRYLLDKMAEEGRGEVEYVALNDDGSAAARRFHERVRNPLLTDITVEWNGLPMTDTFPRRTPDLFSAKPVIVYGRYTKAASGAITLRGRMSGKPFSRTLPVVLPQDQKANDALATLWARERIEDIMMRNPQSPDAAEVTKLGLDYRLMTQYTSFVAVEDKVVTREGKPVVIEVPVEMPEGVSHEGVFGRRGDMAQEARAFKTMGVVAGRPMNGPATPSYLPQRSAAPPPPSPPAPARGESDLARTRQNSGDRKIDLPLAAMVDSTPDKTFKVEVEVWLSSISDGLSERLKKAGFEDTGKSLVAKIRRGRISLAKLNELSAIPEVYFIRLPHR